MKKSHLLSGLVIGLQVLLFTTQVHAFPSILSSFNLTYTTSSTAINGSCQTCHGDSTSTWNEYGWGLLQNGQDFAALEDDTSINSSGLTTMLEEILASTQPGWTVGSNNNLYDSGGLITTTATAPAGIDPLDPLTPVGPVDLTGTIKTSDGTDICAMVLASGQFMFSCNPAGVFSLTDLPRESNGSVKRQIYADGFFPKVDVLTDSLSEAVVMTRSGTCPNYNSFDDPAFVPGSAGKRIDISGKILLQDSATPLCAMALANGQYMFTCDGSGNYALNIPLDSNGQFKLQVYADGFAPITQKFDEFSANNDVRMARAVECQ
jgi:hypothetical protein